MKKISVRALAVCYSLLLVFAPMQSLADQATTSTSVALPPLLITEVQTGSVTSGKDEFIELFNTTTDPIDVTGWQIRYVSAASTTASLANPSATLIVAPPSGAAAVSIPPQSYFVLHTATVSLPTTALGQTYAYTLPASGGSIALMRLDTSTCLLQTVDAFAWGGGAFGKGTPAAATSKDADFARAIVNGTYINAQINSTDFHAQTPALATPAATNAEINDAGQPNIAAQSAAAQADGGATSNGDSDALSTSYTDAACTVPNQGENDASSGGASLAQSTSSDEPPATVATVATKVASTAPTIPAADAGLVAPELTELLPNPAPPLNDADDEFIELYNPNATTFDLSGFSLRAGLSVQHRFVFPTGTMVAPHGFMAFYSHDTKLSLSNSGGQVALLDPFGAVCNQTEAYGLAKDGQAWARANGQWSWTTTPTPNASNLITVPALSKPARKASAGSAQRSVTSHTTTAKTAGLPSNSIANARLTSATAPTPIHPAVLAMVATFALLYGAYEYRNDMANKLYQLRRYRSACRQARSGPARGRGG